MNIRKLFLDENGSPRNPFDKKKSVGRKIFDGYFLCVVSMGLVVFVINNILSKEALFLGLLGAILGITEIVINTINLKKKKETITYVKEEPMDYDTEVDSFDDDFDDDFDDEGDL